MSDSGELNVQQYIFVIKTARQWYTTKRVILASNKQYFIIVLQHSNN